MSLASTKTPSVDQTTPSTANQPSCNPDSAVRSNTILQNHKFVSFDGGVKVEGALARPTEKNFWTAESFAAPAIARGAGLSYAAASFGAGVTTVDHRSFDRVLDFHSASRVIHVEAGMTLGALYSHVIDKKLFLPTQPGHPSITVGGCIAADVHGKNQFLDGTFINQVAEVTLFHPTHGTIVVTPQQEPELFRLTCGGYGLTGNILSAKLKLKSIPSTMAEVSFVPVEDILVLPELLRQSAARADFVFSWHDFAVRGPRFGQGFINEGKFIETDLAIAPHAVAPQTLSSETRGSLKINLFNQLSISALNTLYGAKARVATKPTKLSLFDAIFPIQNSKELYFKFFGTPGFYEYQTVIPSCNFPYFVKSVQIWLQKNDLPVTLASVKLFTGRQDLLRFTGEGTCIALDFPRGGNSGAFLAYLDKLMLECKGIPNIIKDSRLPKEVVEAAYPQFEHFKSMLHQFDPKRLYKSELSDRLGL